MEPPLDTASPANAPDGSARQKSERSTFHFFNWGVANLIAFRICSEAIADNKKAAPPAHNDKGRPILQRNSMSNTAENKIVQLPLQNSAQHAAPKETVALFRVRETVVRYRTLTKVKEPIKTAVDIATLFRKLAPNNVQEHLCLFCLDGSHAVVNCSRVFMGTANSATVHPREIFQIAFLTGAVSIIIAHNHPSGLITESKQDRVVTRRIKEAGELVGIPLLDHVIVSDHSYQSALEKGWL